MIATIQRVVDRVLRRHSKVVFSDRDHCLIEIDHLTNDECDRILEALHESESPSACRVCGKQGRVQVSAQRPSDVEVRAEYLCYDDLGAFLELFADPAIAEFTVVRL